MRQRDVLISAWLIRSSGRTVRADTSRACGADGRLGQVKERTVLAFDSCNRSLGRNLFV